MPDSASHLGLRVGGWKGRAAVAGAVFTLCGVFSEGGLVTTNPWGDVGHYETFARAILDGEIPYHDFSVEYPPLSLPVFVVPALFTEGSTEYLQVFKLTMLLLGLVMIAATSWSLTQLDAGRRQTVAALATLALAPLLLGHVFLNRYDLWPAALIALSTAAFLAMRSALGSGLLAASFAAKVFTAGAVPVALVRLWRVRGPAGVVRGTISFAVVSLLVFGGLLAVAFGGVGHSYWVQAKRELHAESLAGSLLLVGDQLGVYAARIVPGDPGSLDLSGGLPHALAAITTALSAAALVFVWVSYARGSESDARFVLAMAGAALAFLAFAKVFSPQYLTWLLPLVPLVGGTIGLWATGLLAVSLVVTQAEQRGWEGFHVDGWAVWLLGARNLLVVAIFVLLAAALRRTVAGTGTSS